MTAASTSLDALLALVADSKIVDLSARLENEAPGWPTHPPLIIHKTITHEKDGYFTNSLFMPEHVGTHVDAPIHMHPDQPDATIDVASLTDFIGPACVIDVSGLNLDAGETPGEPAILDWEAKHGRIQPGEIVLINFGWYAKHWKIGPESKFYVKNQPGLDGSAVKLLFDRGAKALGSDLTNVDTPNKNGVEGHSYAHRDYFLKHGRPLIETLVNLETLPPRVLFLALPLKIKGGSGSPVRAIAVVPRG
ncbi:MAG: cyclase family protein [Rhizobiales bacterium]|nr:cyclase family protein [Hyphomicrobiales bacterium]